MPLELNIKKWDPTILEYKRTHGHAPKILIMGKSGSGKTTLVQDLLFYIRKIHAGIVICPTEQSLIDYRVMFPESFIHDAWDSNLIANFIRMQKKIRKTDSKFHQLLMLDDIMYDKNAILKDESTRFIFMNGRNNNISMIITMQYCMDLPPDLRNNIDYVIALRDNIHANREKLWRNFFGIIPSADMFHQVMQSCTSGYNCIVLDNTSRSTNIEECIFYYAADSKYEDVRIVRPMRDTYDVQFPDGTYIQQVSKAFLKKSNDLDISNIYHEGEVAKAKYKRTWLSLPPHKRRCFHSNAWKYHDSHFNPEYDDDTAQEARTTTNAGSTTTNSQQQHVSNDFQQQYRRLKKTERGDVQVKII